MAEPRSRHWEALSLVAYATFRDIQSIEIYSVNAKCCHPIENWITRIRRRAPRFELHENGTEAHFENPPPRDYTIKPEFVVRIIGDMISVTEKALVSVLYPKGSSTEVVHIAEPSYKFANFDVDFISWCLNGNVAPLEASVDFLTSEKEQELMDLASRWIVSRTTARIDQEGDGPRSLEKLGGELRQLCEASAVENWAYEDSDSAMETTPETSDDDDDFYSMD
ncbi:MAG: hypothetical protein M1822_007502 [Bathelium mastoideum]|nr:MAG: hypothetical protein M1822_007502 [Bathelium mastoideum]